MSRRAGTILIVALALALALVGVLSRRVSELAAAHAELRRSMRSLHEGSVVPKLAATTLGGDDVVIGAGSPQLLFIFTTTCPYCLATLPRWSEIADSVGRLAPRIHVIGLTPDPIDSVRQYVTMHRVRWPVVRFPDRNIATLYKALTVPQTVLVDSEGHVLYGRSGALSTQVVIDSVYAALARPEPQHVGQGSTTTR